MLPAHAKVLPAHTNPLAAHINVLPAHANVLPVHVDMLPAHSNMLPACTNVLPGNSNVPPAYSNENALNNQTTKNLLCLMKLVNQVITLDESKKCSEQPYYQEPSVSYEISQPSNNTR